MAYKVRRVKLDGYGNVIVVGKRCSTHITPQELNLGGLYFLKPGQLFRVERKL